MPSAVASRLRAAWPPVRRALRAPRLIVAELLAIALAAAALAAIPQLETPLDLARHAEEHPLLAPVAHALALDRVLHSPWLWLPLLAAMASLALVLWDQWRRVARQLRTTPAASAFEHAAYRREFERPARGGTIRIERRLRAGHLGSPLFHSGLALVVVAGLVRALFGRDAAVDLVEGETLPPSPSAFAAQWGGPLSRPLALRAPLRVDGIDREEYPSGALRALAARGSSLEAGGARPVRIAINDPLDAGGERVYLTNRAGVAVVASIRPGGELPTALLLEDAGAGRHEGRGVMGGDLEIVARASAGPAGALPRGVDVRVLRGGALLFAGELQPGGAVALPDGRAFAVEAIRRWARFEASRDPAAALAFAGFAVAIAGLVLLVALVPFDVAVLVRPDGARERVRVALRPHRMAAIFEERFERLVRREGGPPSP